VLGSNLDVALFLQAADKYVQPWEILICDILLSKSNRSGIINQREKLNRCMMFSSNLSHFTASIKNWVGRLRLGQALYSATRIFSCCGWNCRCSNSVKWRNGWAQK
jgi:hypothetical protein